MTIYTKIILGALIAYLSTFLIDRYPFVYIFLKNHPSALQPLNTFGPTNTKTILSKTVRNCEDAILDESNGILILSCDPGRDKWNTVMGTFIDPDTSTGALWYYDYSKTGFEVEGDAHPLTIEGMDGQKWIEMHPLGVGFHAPSRKLAMINHHKDGPSVELFTLSKNGKSATHESTLTDPQFLRTPNSIIFLSATELLVTNDHHFEMKTARFMAQVETYAAYPGGSLVYFNLVTNERKKLVNVPFANGVAVLEGGEQIAVASTSTPNIRIYNYNETSKEVKMEKKVPALFMVDNLKVDSAGKLLVAGHPHPDPIQVQAARNHEYDLDGKGSTTFSKNDNDREQRRDILADEVAQSLKRKPAEERPRAGSWVAELDIKGGHGQLLDLWVGDEYDASTTALRDVKRGVGFVTGLYGVGVLMWRE